MSIDDKQLVKIAGKIRDQLQALSNSRLRLIHRKFASLVEQMHRFERFDCRLTKCLHIGAQRKRLPSPLPHKPHAAAIRHHLRSSRRRAVALMAAVRRTACTFGSTPLRATRAISQR